MAASTQLTLAATMPLSSGPEGERGDGILRLQHAHRPRFGPSHGTFFCRHQVIVARKVQPAVDEIEGEFRAEVAAVRAGIGSGGIGGNAYFTRGAEERVTLEGDYVRGGRVGQEFGVQRCEFTVSEKYDRKLALGNRRGSQSDGGGIGIEHGNRPGHTPTFESEPRVPIGDRNLARCPVSDRWVRSP